MRLGIAIAAGIAVFAIDAATADAGEPAAGEPNPLARDYVDIGFRGGIAWRGNVGDSRDAPFGWTGGATIDFGRAPFWGGIYADASTFGGSARAVDPKTNEPSELRSISAGLRAKVALQLRPRLYLFPALGAGAGSESYSSGHRVISNGGSVCNCNTASISGFSVIGEATFAYVWRFGAVTFQPLRVTSFLFESNRSVANPPGYDYGVARNGVAFAATIGVSVDPAAMVLAVWDAAKSLVPHQAP